MNVKKMIYLLVLLLFGEVVVGQTKTLDIKVCKGDSVILEYPCNKFKEGCALADDMLFKWKNITTNINLNRYNNNSKIKISAPNTTTTIRRTSTYCDTSIVNFNITVNQVDSIIFKETGTWEYGLDKWQYSKPTKQRTEITRREDTSTIILSIEKGTTDTILSNIFTTPLTTNPKCISFASDNPKIEVKPIVANSNNFKFEIKAKDDSFVLPYEANVWAYCNQEGQILKTDVKHRAKNKYVYSKFKVIAYRKPKIPIIFVRVNQKDTGVGTHNFIAHDFSADYQEFVDTMNEAFYKDAVIKFEYKKEIIIDTNFDMLHDSIINLSFVDTALKEEQTIIRALQNNVNYKATDTAIYVFWVYKIDAIGYARTNYTSRFINLFMNTIDYQFLKNNSTHAYYINKASESIAHEIGHLLGLSHAKAYDFLADTFILSSSCGAKDRKGYQEYDDPDNVMDYCKNCGFRPPHSTCGIDVYFRYFQWKVLHDRILRWYRTKYPEGTKF